MNPLAVLPQRRGTTFSLKSNLGTCCCLSLKAVHKGNIETIMLTPQQVASQSKVGTKAQRLTASADLSPPSDSSNLFNQHNLLLGAAERAGEAGTVTGLHNGSLSLGYALERTS